MPCDEREQGIELTTPEQIAPSASLRTIFFFPAHSRWAYPCFCQNRIPSLGLSYPGRGPRTPPPFLLGKPSSASSSHPFRFHVHSPALHSVLVLVSFPLTLLAPNTLTYTFSTQSLPVAFLCPLFRTATDSPCCPLSCFCMLPFPRLRILLLLSTSFPLSLSSASALAHPTQDCRDHLRHCLPPVAVCPALDRGLARKQNYHRGEEG